MKRKEIKRENRVVNKVLKFVDSCRFNSRQWAFASSIGGEETLYASCFACMIYNCLNKLEGLTSQEKKIG